jgi:hypothetical protein
MPLGGVFLLFWIGIDENTGSRLAKVVRASEEMKVTESDYKSEISNGQL